MSPAELSRRSLVAAVASATSVGITTPSIAASHPAAKPDPIFGLIEAHRRAYRAFEDALDDKSRAEERLQAEIGTSCPRVQCFVLEPEFFFSHGGSTPEDLLKNARHIEARSVYRSARSHDEIDTLLKSDPAQAKSAHAELDALLSRQAEILDPHEAAEEKSSDAAADARLNLFEFAPTSLSGLIALMRYLRTTMSDGNEVFSGDEDFNPLLDAIERSVCALAGQKPRSAEVL
jgi:hypothetical protein